MTYTLQLAHVNDTHSHFEPTLLHFDINVNNINYQLNVNCGGYANISGALSPFRQQAALANQSCLFLHAGDSFQGSLYFSCFKGEANATLLNLLKPDAMTIGNHEFDLGNTPVADFLKRINFPMLAGNMDLSAESQTKPSPLRPHANLLCFDNQRQIARYLLKTITNQQGEAKQLAIVGITLDLMDKIGCPDPDCHFLDAVATTQATVKHLHQQGIKHIIVLSHLGYQGDLELAAAVSGISVIVGGHTHTLSGDFSALNIPCTGQSQQMVNNTLILHAGQHAESLGLSKLSFNQDGLVTKLEGGVKFLITDDWQATNNQQPITSEQRRQIQQYLDHSDCFNRVTPDSTIELLINNHYRPAVEEMRQRVIANLPTPLFHSRLPNDQLAHGSEIAPLVAQAFYHAASNDKAIDFGLHNAGGVRVSVKSGDLTQAEIAGRLLPFAIPIISYWLSGKDLKQALEGAINNALSNGVKGTGNGSYPYTHLLKFEYNANLAKHSRISSLMLWRDEQWIEVLDQQQYCGVSSSYTLAGKEGYDCLLNSTGHHDHQVTMADSFIDFIGAATFPINNSTKNNLIL